MRPLPIRRRNPPNTQPASGCPLPAAGLLPAVAGRRLSACERRAKPGRRAICRFRGSIFLRFSSRNRPRRPLRDVKQPTAMAATIRRRSRTAPTPARASIRPTISRKRLRAASASRRGSRLDREHSASAGRRSDSYRRRFGKRVRISAGLPDTGPPRYREEANGARDERYGFYERRRSSASLGGAEVKAQRPVAAGRGNGKVVTVKPGETLYSLAIRHGVTVDMIVRANGLTSRHLRQAGHRSSDPAGRTGEVRPGARRNAQGASCGVRGRASATR